jgi:hypothetical protein
MTHINYITILAFAAGIVTAIVWRFVRDRGHAVFGVKDERVQGEICRILRRYTTLVPFNFLHTGPTHQKVFFGGKVICYYDESPIIARLPKNVCSNVVWGRARRRRAAHKLVMHLQNLGYQTSSHEPLPDFPAGSLDFILIRSTAFYDCAIAFRAHWVVMEWRRWIRKRRLLEEGREF